MDVVRDMNQFSHSPNNSSNKRINPSAASSLTSSVGVVGRDEADVDIHDDRKRKRVQ
jgi:hypothetical protein